MSKEKNVNDEQNRCRRCDRPLSNPNDIYGWRCAEIVGQGGRAVLESLDEAAENAYNTYVANYMQNDKESFLEKMKRPTDKKEASEVIKRNATAIKNAGAYYEVNPAIIAACIYTEQTTNVNQIDAWTDLPLYFADTSIGIGQVKVSTARMLEDNGYIAKTKMRNSHSHAGFLLPLWDVPGYETGAVHAGNRNEAIAKRLTSESENINYVAAYLRYFQDRWKDVYPEIDGRTAVLATLFNQGEKRPPHSNPISNPFGEQAKENYSYMCQLLGLE